MGIEWGMSREKVRREWGESGERLGGSGERVGREMGESGRRFWEEFRTIRERSTL